MKDNFIKNIVSLLLVILVTFYPLEKTFAISYDWLEVPKSEYGEQLWDKNSFHKNRDGSIRVFSKFIPKSNTQITQEILYTMDINCVKHEFKDIAVGVNRFNEFKNKDSEWKRPNGDKLIVGVINQVCAY